MIYTTLIIICLILTIIFISIENKKLTEQENITKNNTHTLEFFQCYDELTSEQIEKLVKNQIITGNKSKDYEFYYNGYYFKNIEIHEKCYSYCEDLKIYFTYENYLNIVHKLDYDNINYTRKELLGENKFREYNKNYYKENKEERLKYQKEYAKKNSDKIKKYQSNEEYKEKRRIYQKNYRDSKIKNK